VLETEIVSVQRTVNSLKKLLIKIVQAFYLAFNIKII